MNAVAYIRKSTSGTDEGGVERQEGSFDRQRAAILDYAKRKGIEILEPWYEEPVSGKSIRKRKVFLQMVKDAKRPGRPFKAILFGEYDRFMRDVKEAMRYEVELDDAGVELHFSNLKNDGSTADQIYKSVVREMAAEYSRELARKVVQGMVRAAKRGSWAGGVPPFGYRIALGENGLKQLIIEDAESKTVQEMFAFSLKGWGHRKIATHLNNKGIPTSTIARNRKSLLNRNIDGKWTGDTIRAMLRNPVYKGVYRWNKKARVDCFDWKLEGQGTIDIGKLRTQTESFRREGLGAFYIDRLKPQDEWIVREGAVPAIVSGEIFDEVQTRFQVYSRKSWRRSNTNRYLMSGFLRCKTCGNGIHGHRYSKIVKATGERAFYEYYRCSGDVKKASHGEASRPMMRRERVDKVVREGILKRAQALMDPFRLRTLFRNRIEEYIANHPDRLAAIEKELLSIDKETERLIEAYSKFERPIPEERVHELNLRKKELLDERARLWASDAVSLSSIDIDKEVEMFLNNFQDVEEVFEKSDPIARNRLRDAFLQTAEVEWGKDDKAPEVRLTWFKLPYVCGVEKKFRLHHF